MTLGDRLHEAPRQGQPTIDPTPDQETCNQGGGRGDKDAAPQDQQPPFVKHLVHQTGFLDRGLVIGAHRDIHLPVDLVVDFPHLLEQSDDGQKRCLSILGQLGFLVDIGQSDDFLCIFGDFGLEGGPFSGSFGRIKRAVDDQIGNETISFGPHATGLGHDNGRLRPLRAFILQVAQGIDAGRGDG